jgi:hypothetical protein
MGVKEMKCNDVELLHLTLDSVHWLTLVKR